MDDKVVYISEIRDIFNKYGIELLTGEEGMERCVSSISVLELDLGHQNPAWYLGGELVLSTFLMFDSVDSIIQAVHILADRGVAALGIHQGVVPSRPDDRIITAAKELGLPVFSIPHDMPYSIIFTWVYERIFSKRATTILESEKINSTLTQALFARDSVEAIARTLSGILQKTTAVLDENNNLLAAASIGKDGEVFLSLLKKGMPGSAFSDEKEILLPEQTCRIALSSELSGYEAVMRGSFSEHNLVGSIVILAKKSQSAYEMQMDMLGLMHSATAYAIVQMRRKAVIEAEDRLRGDLYSDLLSGIGESEEYVAVRADKLGIRLNGIHCVLEIISEELNGRQNDDVCIYYGKRLKSVVMRVCEANNIKCAVLSQSKGHLIILHFPYMTKPEIQKKQILKIYDAVSRLLSGGISELYVGVGETVESLMKLAQSCRQASRAAVLGKKIMGSGGLYFFGQMGIYSLLDAKDMEELHRNCLKELDHIEKAFHGSRKVYLDTLEAYFACGENIAEMARELGIHVNTAKYRMKKIKEVLGENIFENGNEKMRIYLLLKMKKLIK